MKKLTTVLLCMLAAAMLLLGGCLAEESLAGSYMLDASPLGMPITVYLTIDENNQFQWTNRLEGGTDKGSGKIGSQDGLYMMVYSDSTNDNMKTATFTVDGGKLVFSTRVPYGAASLSPNTEDPDSTIWPVAKKLAYEEWLGQYVGSLEISAMGSAIVYNVELTLDYGAEYALKSTFAMGGETYTYEQAGAFEIADGKIALLGKDGQTGAIDENGIVVSAFLSQMAGSPREVTLQKATTADVAGVYTGIKDMSMMGFTVSAKLELNAVGGYTYTAAMEGEEDYVLEGAFSCDNGALTLNREEGEPFTGTLENDVIAIKLPISASVPMTTAITFYGDRIQGQFTAETTAEDGSVYQSLLTLSPDGTYTIAVQKDGADAYQESGTFATEASMTGTMLVLTSLDGAESTGMVDATINVTHNIDAAYNTLGFKYSK